MLNNEAKKSRTITVSLINHIIRMILDLSVCFQQCFFITQRRVILKKYDSILVRYTDACCFSLKSLGIHCLHYAKLCVCFYLKLVLIKPRTNGRNCWFSHDVTKIQTTKLSRLQRFYFHGVLEQLKTNFQTNFRFKRVVL